MATERTRLTEEFEGKKYVTQTDFQLIVKRKTRQFQCCLCALLLYEMSVQVADVYNDINTYFRAVILCVMVITISYIGANGTDNEIQRAIESGQKALSQRDDMERNTVLLKSASPSFRHQMSMSTSTRADSLGRAGYASYHASKHIAANRARYNITKPLEPLCNIRELKDIGWCSTSIESTCSGRYRSIDGSCNNLKHPFVWGVGHNKFRRMLEASYTDGVGEPRSSALNGIVLPAASRVSRVVHRPSYKNDPNFTIMVAVWGQFLDHDITATALSRTKDGGAIACCVTQARTSAHPECFPVFEEQPDGTIRCIDFVRSAPAVTCCLAPREQINQVSSYIDGSAVYGGDPKLARRLRSFSNGTLATLSLADGRQLLPISDDPNDGCNRMKMISKGQYCFLSGDSRANENLHLTTMHLLWVRQHNQIANQLQHINPHWDDERLYQETRHIIAAQLQHITYTEFLPVVIGSAATVQLVASQHQYDVETDASIANAFAAAAFRFAHTLIPALVKILGNDTTSDEYVKLHQILFDPFRLYGDDALDRILRGAMDTSIEAADPYFNEEIKRHLFERNDDDNNTTNPHPKSCGGLDLVALNIQRGRDHGLPGYTAWRKQCGLSYPSTFADMSAYIDDESLQRIAKLYNHIDDVDLYTGALSERPLNGTLLGPTANCIIVDQFMRLKRGDRFWYETAEEPQAFTRRQLEQIRRTTLATVICDTSDSINFVSQYVMRRANTSDNPTLKCSTIDRIDFSHWKN